MASVKYLPSIASQLDLFQANLVQSAQLGCQTIVLRPISTITPGSVRIEFAHSGQTEHYRNLRNSFLQLSLKIEKKDGGQSMDKVNVSSSGQTSSRTAVGSLINYACHTLFSSIEIMVNGTSVNLNSSNYHYRAIIETLLGHENQDIPGHLRLAGYRHEVGEKIFDLQQNPQMKASYEDYRSGRERTLFGRIHTDITNQSRYFPPGCDLTFNFNLNPSSLILRGPDMEYFHVRITDACLLLELVSVAPSISLSHEKTLSTRNAHYPLQHTNVKSFVLSQGQMGAKLSNILSGRLPTIVLVAFVSNKAFAGSREYNPFFFAHYDLTSATLTINGQSREIGNLDFENRSYASAYYSLLRAAGLLHNGQSCLIGYDDYDKGLTILGWDLSLDGNSINNQGLVVAPYQSGVLDLSLTFAKPLPEPVNVLVYSVTEGYSLELDKHRNVFLN